MIEVEIPKDVRKFESKVVGPFSARQAVCLAIATPIILVSYFLLDFLATDTRMFVSAILGIPILAFGWYKPYGIKLEDFLKTAFISAMLSPKNRLYKTNNVYGDKIVSNQSKKSKKNNNGPVHKSSNNYEAFK